MTNKKINNYSNEFLIKKFNSLSIYNADRITFFKELILRKINIITSNIEYGIFAIKILSIKKHLLWLLILISSVLLNFVFEKIINSINANIFLLIFIFLPFLFTETIKITNQAVYHIVYLLFFFPIKQKKFKFNEYSIYSDTFTMFADPDFDFIYSSLFFLGNKFFHKLDVVLSIHKTKLLFDFLIFLCNQLTVSIYKEPIIISNNYFEFNKISKPQKFYSFFDNSSKTLNKFIELNNNLFSFNGNNKFDLFSYFLKNYLNKKKFLNKKIYAVTQKEFFIAIIPKYIINFYVFGFFVTGYIIITNKRIIYKTNTNSIENYYDNDSNCIVISHSRLLFLFPCSNKFSCSFYSLIGLPIIDLIALYTQITIKTS
jgi:hypothetical protein